MKTMKKVLAWILALVTVFSLAACGQEEPAATTEEEFFETKKVVYLPL